MLAEGKKNGGVPTKGALLVNIDGDVIYSQSCDLTNLMHENRSSSDKRLERSRGKSLACHHSLKRFFKNSTTASEALTAAK